MAETRDWMEKHGISLERRRELEYFCRQYGEKRARLAALLEQYGPSGLSLGLGGGKAQGGHGDPTVWAVARREQLLRDCEDIEQAALGVAGEMAGDPVELAMRLIEHMADPTGREPETAPCGRRQFYALRRRFLIALHKRRLGS